jgi:NAD(P)-dependent dehydrogenase (short-subunit alcohol dehydrogenase family)
MSEIRSALGAVESPPFSAPPFPQGLLTGQVGFVTGGGSGMGLGMARAFAQAGADVAIIGRSIDRLKKAISDLQAFGVRAHAVACDVRKPDAVKDAFDEVEQVLGPVSILANNAGGNFPVLAEQMSPNAWRAILQIAVDGTFLCSTEFARRRKSTMQPGAIVNNSAQYIWTGFPGDAHSATAKAAIAHMTLAMARDWKADRIRVNCVAAGFFPHPDAVVGALDEDTLTRMGSMFPIGRPGDLREWGWLATLLVSPLTEGMTGQTALIDGGDRLRRELMSPAFVAPRERNNPWGELPQ